MRRRRGLTQEQFALSAGIDRRYMSDIETGKRNVSLDILEKIAGALGLSAAELLCAADRIDAYPSALDKVKEALVEMDFSESIVFENPDYADAVVGVTADGRVVYRFSDMVLHLMVHYGMSDEEAREFISYNTERALPYMGGSAPIILYDLTL